MKSFSNLTFPTLLTVGRMWIAQMHLRIWESTENNKRKKKRLNCVQFALLRLKFSIEQFAIFGNHNAAYSDYAFVAFTVWRTAINYHIKNIPLGVEATKIPSTQPRPFLLNSSSTAAVDVRKWHGKLRPTCTACKNESQIKSENRERVRERESSRRMLFVHYSVRTSVVVFSCDIRIFACDFIDEHFLGIAYSLHMLDALAEMPHVLPLHYILYFCHGIFKFVVSDWKFI